MSLVKNLRDFSIFFICIFVGKIVAIYDYSIGFNVAFISIVLFVMGPRMIKVFRLRSFRCRVLEIYERLGMKVLEPEARLSFWKLKGVKISNAQLVFENSYKGKNYWAVCGGWWFGCVSNSIAIYEEDINGYFSKIEQRENIEE